MTIGTSKIEIGIGLRHAHYKDITDHPKNIDFVEIHSENFYAKGGASLDLLDEVLALYPVSFHGTSMALGSAMPTPEFAIKKLQQLCEHRDPKFISDHACFSWGQLTIDKTVSNKSTLAHGGDLLPIVFNDESLSIFCENIDRLQTRLKRSILIENLSAYLTIGENTLEETAFLNALCDKTGCGLILDVNNLIVNARNELKPEQRTELNNNSLILNTYANRFIDKINQKHVKEIHLAGCTPAPAKEIMVDDHSQPVPQSVWDSYAYACKKMGSRATLIEWDNNIPSLDILLAEADKARKIATHSIP